MNDSSVNHTYLDNWDACLDQFYVVTVLSFASQALCFFLGTPALVWCLWLSLNGSLSGGLKPTQVFPINLFEVELVFFVEVLLEVFSYLFIRKAIMLWQGVSGFYNLSWTCRPLFQSCICVERYLAVAQPVAFFKYFKFSLLLLHPACAEAAWSRRGRGGRGGEKKQGTTDPHKMRVFGIVLTNLVIILASSIPVAVGWATLSSSLEITCNVFPMLMIMNIFSVLVSPLLHFYREGRMPC